MKTPKNISVTNCTLQCTNASGGFSYVCKKNNNCFNNMYYTYTENIGTGNFIFDYSLTGIGTDGMGNIGSYKGYGEEYENFSNNMLALQQAYELYRLQQKLEKIWVNKSWFELNLPNEFKIYNSARLMPDDPPFKNTQSSTTVPNFVPTKENFNASTYMHREAAAGGGSDISLFFDGNRLHIIDESTGRGVYNTIAYSGKGKHMNNPTSQNIQDLGPIPHGNYTINNTKWSQQSTLRQLYNIVAGNGDWGDYNVPLIPTTYQGPRNSFYLHGGFFEGSAGCIDAGQNIGNIYNVINTQRVTTLRVRY